MVARSANDCPLLGGVMALLASAGAPCLLFGGWAEDLLGLSPSRAHRDIDLLLPAASFATVDRLTAQRSTEIAEVRAKRFAHKRAFLYRGFLVEIILVEQDGQGPVTRFWGDRELRWLTPLSALIQPWAFVSPANLDHYRRLHGSLEPWRWRDPRSIVA
jgi:hypothetical protein